MTTAFGVHGPVVQLPHNQLLKKVDFHSLSLDPNQLWNQKPTMEDFHAQFSRQKVIYPLYLCKLNITTSRKLTSTKQHHGRGRRLAGAFKMSLQVIIIPGNVSPMAWRMVVRPPIRQPWYCIFFACEAVLDSFIYIYIYINCC